MLELVLEITIIGGDEAIGGNRRVETSCDREESMRGRANPVRWDSGETDRAS